MVDSTLSSSPTCKTLLLFTTTKTPAEINSSRDHETPVRLVQCFQGHRNVSRRSGIRILDSNHRTDIRYSSEWGVRSLIAWLSSMILRRFSCPPRPRIVCVVLLSYYSAIYIKALSFWKKQLFRIPQYLNEVSIKSLLIGMNTVSHQNNTLTVPKYHTWQGTDERHSSHRTTNHSPHG